MPTLTVAEYNALGWRGRLGYRLFRNPLVMFGIGPIWSMMIAAALHLPLGARPRLRRSVLRHQPRPARLIVGALLARSAGSDYLLVQAAHGRCSPAPPASGSSTSSTSSRTPTGRAADDWSYADAALRGSSYLKLPKVLQFFTGNIGLHHVHHLSARIPNYNLQRAHDDEPDLPRRADADDW